MELHRPVSDDMTANFFASDPKYIQSSSSFGRTLLNKNRATRSTYFERTTFNTISCP